MLIGHVTIRLPPRTHLLRHHISPCLERCLNGVTVNCLPWGICLPLAFPALCSKSQDSSQQRRLIKERKKQTVSGQQKEGCAKGPPRP